MDILAIESSCDETAAAVIRDGREIISSVVATQIEEHKLYGGVVPEIASRRHCESIVAVVDEALQKAGMKAQDVDAIAVSYAPGLIGALLVGVNFAKGLALSLDKPLIPVHHIRGHIAANYLAHPELEPPYLDGVRNDRSDCRRRRRRSLRQGGARYGLSLPRRSPHRQGGADRRP